MGIRTRIFTELLLKSIIDFGRKKSQNIFNIMTDLQRKLLTLLIHIIGHDKVKKRKIAEILTEHGKLI